MLAALVKNWKISLWLAAVILSVLVIFLRSGSGYEVTASDVPEMSAGDSVLAVAGVPVSESVMHKNYTGLTEIQLTRGKIYIQVDGTLPFSAQKASATNLNFGLDVKGGISAIVQPKEQGLSGDLIPILQERINFYGLKEATFKPISFQGTEYVEVSIAGGTKEEITRLLTQEGKFDAKVPILLSRGISAITLEKNHAFNVSDSVIVDGKSYASGDVFALDGIQFQVGNVTSQGAEIVATVYKGTDIKAVYLDSQRASIRKADNGYVWDFSLELTQEAAQKFAQVTKNMPLRADGAYLASQISIYLDNKLMNSFDISSTLKGRAETTIQISGGSPTRDEAVRERREITSVLRSGSLPTSIEILQINQVSPTLGSAFIGSVLSAGLAAAAGVSLIVLLRYRRPKIILPMIAVSLSEVLMILGLSVALGATLDLPAMTGIVAAIGTGVDSQIIILDQSAKRKEETLKEKLKKAFFIIFGAGGVLIASMLPLLGMAALRGFAITTILGVLIGILITRPAFGAMVEKIVKE
ncbi:MAG TPA: hypothetical protein VI979_02215 [archaeon]|nr:hypothetical protein [archaeon]